MIDKGQWWEFGQDTGVTPLFFTRSAMGFLMTTESQDLGLTSHPERCSCSGTHVPVAQWYSIALAAQKVVGSIPSEHT